MGVTITDSEVSDSGEYILRRIPDWMPTDRTTGNFKVLDTVGHAIDRLDDDIDSLDKATTVQYAETIDQLEELAKLVDLPSKQSEGKEKYRSRLIAEFQQMTNEGSTRELIENTATILDVDETKIGFKKVHHGLVQLTIPGNALDSLSITSTEFVTITGELIAAGFNLRAIRRGTLTYLDESAYGGPYDSANGGYDPGQLSSDPAKGHDGLDSNDDPKNNGGTYAGLIE
jgi:hypothetical protein